MAGIFWGSVSLLRHVSIAIAGECDQGCFVGPWHAPELGGVQTRT